MIAIVLIPLTICIINFSFLTQAGKEIDKGAKWYYVGKQPLDSKAKSLPLQITVNGEPSGEPFIVWKLKLEK